MTYSSNPSSISNAAAVFAVGFSFTKNIVHEYTCSQVGSSWHLSDAPRTSGAYRRDEWIVCSPDPSYVDETAKAHSSRNFCISAIVPVEDDEKRTRDQFKELGYRLSSTEAVMAHADPCNIRNDSPARIVRVKDKELMVQVNKAAGRRQMLDEHLGTDDELRVYAAVMDGSRWDG